MRYKNMNKGLFIIMIIFYIKVNSFSQYSVNLLTSGYSHDFSVKVGEDIMFSELSVKISENIIGEDFTVGFTNLKSKADVIIANTSSTSDLSILITNSAYADMTIKVSENIFYEDISIEIKSSGLVDYLIYNEDNFLSREKLVVALLPIINSHLDYKFDKIPYWSKNKGIGKPEDVLKPSIYCCPLLNHWIDSVEDGILHLEDGSIWLIYKEDIYNTLLWLPVDNIKIKPSEYPGHYYLSKYNSISEIYETVRAICIKN